MESFIEIALLLIFAAIKFILAAGYLLIDRGHSYPETVAILAIGGSVGVVVFYYTGNYINQFFKRITKRKKPQKLFTPQSRSFVKIKSKYGIIGIALLSPIFFSIPLGCFLASRFFRNKKSTLPFMLISVIFWSIILPLLKLYWQP